MVHRFAREELYRLVWAKPISILAKELGVSDVGLAKACRRADIPTPGLGYWSKVKHGKKVKRISLPTPTPKTLAVVQINSGTSNSQLYELPPEIKEKIVRESTAEWLITVPRTLSKPHPIVGTWRKLDRHRRNDACEHRRLRILSALFAGLDKRGCGVVVNPQNPYDMTDD